MEGQRLKSVITQSVESFGTSESGSAWCVKALHPSDPVTATQGIPDGSSVSSVLMNYQSAFTLQDTTVTSTWGFDMWCLPHPITFFYAGYFNSSQASLYALNPQIVGSSAYEKTRTFLRLAEQHRLAYYSVTLVHNASATTNQGTVAACQHSAVHRELTFSNYTGTGILSQMPTACYQLEDFPAYEEMQSMPSAYLGAMRDGVYAPLKLTKTCQQWRNHTALRQWIPRDNYSYDVQSQRALQTTSVTCPPYGVMSAAGTFGASGVSEFTFTNMDSNSAFISARGLSKESSVTVYVRVGIEMQVSPLSSLAPQQTIAPPQDEVALRTYFAVVRELKDAYSADYNDRDKLWRTINSALRTALPAVVNSILPGAGMLVGPAIDVSEGLLKKVQANRQKKKKKKRAKRNNAQPRNAPVNRGKRPLKVVKVNRPPPTR